MALQSLHEHFWPGDGQENEEPEPVTQGYVNAASIAGLFYLGGVPLSAWLRRLGSWVAGKLPERLWLLLAFTRLIFSADYQRARLAVRSVAVTPGVREKKMWGEIGSRAAKVNGLGEDVFRRLLAVEQMGRASHRQRHRQNLLIELAHFAHREH